MKVIFKTCLSHSQDKQFNDQCGTGFIQTGSLKTHVSNLHHLSRIFQCAFCDLFITQNIDELKNHQKNEHKLNNNINQQLNKSNNFTQIDHEQSEQMNLLNSVNENYFKVDKMDLEFNLIRGDTLNYQIDHQLSDQIKDLMSKQKFEQTNYEIKQTNPMNGQMNSMNSPFNQINNQMNDQINHLTDQNSNRFYQPNFQMNETNYSNCQTINQLNANQFATNSARFHQMNNQMKENNNFYPIMTPNNQLVFTTNLDPLYTFNSMTNQDCSKIFDFMY